MQKDGVKTEMSPIVTWVIIGVVLLITVIVGFKFLGNPGGGQFQKGGSEELMKKVQSGGKLYEPPAGIVPKAAPTGQQNAMPHGGP